MDTKTKKLEELTNEEIDALSPDEYEDLYDDWCKRCEEEFDAQVEREYI